MQRIQAHQPLAMPGDDHEAAGQWAAEHLASYFNSNNLLILPFSLISLISYSTLESYVTQLLTARQSNMQEAVALSIRLDLIVPSALLGIQLPRS